MTKVEKNDLLYEHLKLIIPAFEKLKAAEGRALIDRINECLAETPFMYVIFGNGVGVTLKSVMNQLGKTITKKDIEL